MFSVLDTSNWHPIVFFPAVRAASTVASYLEITLALNSIVYILRVCLPPARLCVRPSTPGANFGSFFGCLASAGATMGLAATFTAAVAVPAPPVRGGGESGAEAGPGVAVGAALLPLAACAVSANDISADDTIMLTFRFVATTLSLSIRGMLETGAKPRWVLHMATTS